MRKGHYKHQSLVDLTCRPANLPPQPPPDIEPRPSPHAAGCWCVRCWDAGLEVGEYLRAKKIFDQNGF